MRVRNRTIGIVFAGIIVAVAAIIVGVSLLAQGPSSFTVHGNEITCIDAPDVTDGSQVTITANSGTVLATGVLATDTSKSALAEEKQYAQVAGLLVAFGDNSATMNAYTFTASVPDGQARYGVAVGGSNRGTLWFTDAQMKAGPQVGLGCS